MFLRWAIKCGNVARWRETKDNVIPCVIMSDAFFCACYLQVIRKNLSGGNSYPHIACLPPLSSNEQMSDCREDLETEREKTRKLVFFLLRRKASSSTSIPHLFLFLSLFLSPPFQRLTRPIVANTDRRRRSHDIDTREPARQTAPMPMAGVAIPTNMAHELADEFAKEVKEASCYHSTESIRLKRNTTEVGRGRVFIRMRFASFLPSIPTN